ncbi:MAG: hypothetical protein ACK5LV_09065 [Lachnospirales bacterium]
MYYLEKIALKSKFNKIIIFEYTLAIVFVALSSFIFQVVTEIVLGLLKIHNELLINLTLMFFVGIIVGFILWAKLVKKQEKPLNRVGFRLTFH